MQAHSQDKAGRQAGSGRRHKPHTSTLFNNKGLEYTSRTRGPSQHTTLVGLPLQAEGGDGANKNWPNIHTINTARAP